MEQNSPIFDYDCGNELFRFVAIGNSHMQLKEKYGGILYMMILKLPYWKM